MLAGFGERIGRGLSIRASGLACIVLITAAGHAGAADVIEVPKALAEMAKTVVGVDLRSDNIQCAAEIRVIDDA
jgi:hypothetical protein